MKKFINEFKSFALKSNVLELAIAVIMGAAASNMVTALVDSILMPIIGIFMGGKDFSTLSYTIGDASIKYGAFIQAAINFLIISIIIFLITKGIAKLSKTLRLEEEKAEEKKPTTEDYLKEIRDLLREDKK